MTRNAGGELDRRSELGQDFVGVSTPELDLEVFGHRNDAPQLSMVVHVSDCTCVSPHDCLVSWRVSLVEDTDVSILGSNDDTEPIWGDVD